MWRVQDPSKHALVWCGCEPAGGAVASALAGSAVCRPLPDTRGAADWNTFPPCLALQRGKTLIQLLWEYPVSGVSGAEEIAHPYLIPRPSLTQILLHIQLFCDFYHA